MKRNQKMKILAFSMFAGMVAASAPRVKAVELEKYQSTASSESEAQIVMSLNSSSTAIKPGDKFTVTLSLDKLPDNNLGVGSVSFRLVYDDTKVSATKETTPFGEIPKLVAGPVGTFLNIGDAGFGTSDKGETIAVGMSTDSRAAYKCPTGDVLTLEFTALDTVTPGSIEMYMAANYEDPSGDKTKNIPGFSVSGVKLEGTTASPDDTMPVYLNSNLDDMAAVVEAESVRFADNNPVDLDTVNKKTAVLGNQLEIDPTGAQGNKVTWTSSNPAVATVDSQGTVTAVGNGTTVITATVDGKSATKTVNVVVSPESVDFDITQDLNLDKTTKPTISLKDNVKITPADAKVTSLDWSSSDPSVATVDQNGTVTAVGNGECEITVRYSDTLYDKITVKVTTSVASVQLAKNTVVLDVVEKTTDEVAYTLNPEDAQPQAEATATSSDPSVATATVENGKVVVTAHKQGTAKITLTVDGKTATMDVKVTVPLSAITLDKDSVTVYKGESDTVKVSADPEGSAWESLAQSTKSGTGAKAEVNEQTGVVTITGLERGESVISVYANNDQTGAFIKDVNVTVKENRVTALTVEGQEEEFLRGQTQTLTTNYTTEEPETTHKTTDDTTITWTSSDPDVATVDSEGKVTAVSGGTATITAKMEGSANKVEATYDVTVVEHPVEGIVFADEDKKVLEDGLNVEPGDVVTIPFTVDPENTTDTPEEILEMVNAYFDNDAVDVEVTYENGKGEIKLTFKKDGNADGIVSLGELDEEDLEEIKEIIKYYDQYKATGKVPEELLVDDEGNPLEGEEREELEEIIKEVFDNFYDYLAIDGIYLIRANVATPAPENVDTSDIPVAATAAVMMISLGGIVITKKVLVK